MDLKIDVKAEVADVCILYNGLKGDQIGCSHYGCAITTLTRILFHADLYWLFRVVAKTHSLLQFLIASDDSL